MTIAALYRYPVKSMLGESLTRAVLDARGVLGDRAYAVLDVETGIVASAKVPKRWAKLLEFSAAFVTEPVPGQEAPPVILTFPDGSTRRSDDPAIDQALCEVLDREVQLITTPPDGVAFEELWVDIEGVERAELGPEHIIEATTKRQEDTGEAISHFDVAAFAPPGRFYDLAALHVITQSTLDRLRELAPDSDFDARRYRPNVVLGDTHPAGSGPGFVENDWPGREMTLGSEVRVAFTFQTMRCVMTTLAQEGLPEDRNTLRTVAKNNRIHIDKPEVAGMWACAGVYADVPAGGEIAVGDAHA
ncbi:MOSC domain-containing protein [Pseudonocardia broussonetiae]|uniref:MOSC domain-containing protein n=1 Tax=Pseudonocardia broussonetiae TaxID=2736640 RepID=A0A6M6JVQ7_9PSEU|nr:MOSC N-terminal beta barrel domain-containing protein [Pseudonocardia broussonetiae]QJY51137.1 MOSC domain-containing protein [Pseudonocardia broussonetiae]